MHIQHNIERRTVQKEHIQRLRPSGIFHERRIHGITANKFYDDKRIFLLSFLRGTNSKGVATLDCLAFLRECDGICRVTFLEQIDRHASGEMDVINNSDGFEAVIFWKNHLCKICD